MHLFGHGLGEILDRLGLARAGGSGGRATQVELERAHERHVAAVRQRRDDEAQRVAQVLVAVGERCLHHAYDEALRLFEVAHLADPRKVGHAGNTLLDQALHHVARVDVEHDERAHRHLLRGWGERVSTDSEDIERARL